MPNVSELTLVQIFDENVEIGLTNLNNLWFHFFLNFEKRFYALIMEVNNQKYNVAYHTHDDWLALNNLVMM
jgi:hypothetical protein